MYIYTHTPRNTHTHAHTHMKYIYIYIYIRLDKTDTLCLTIVSLIRLPNGKIRHIPISIPSKSQTTSYEDIVGSKIE